MSPNASSGSPQRREFLAPGRGLVAARYARAGLKKVEAIGDLAALWLTLPSTVGVEATSIASCDFDLRMLAERVRTNLSRSIRQNVDHLSSFKI